MMTLKKQQHEIPAFPHARADEGIMPVIEVRLHARIVRTPNHAIHASAKDVRPMRAAAWWNRYNFSLARNPRLESCAGVRPACQEFAARWPALDFPSWKSA